MLKIIKHAHNENMQTFCKCQDWDTILVPSQPHPKMTTNADAVKLPTISEFILAQRKDAYCNQMKQLVDTSNCHFTFDKKIPLVKQVPLDRSIHKLLLLKMCVTILCLAHHSILAGHPGERRM